MGHVRDYPRLPIEEFGKQLILTEDLDPVYTALHRLGDHLSQNQKKRWLVAYWCIYHCGLASYLSEFEGDAFWDALFEAATSKKECPVGGLYPRGHERRHFRGKLATESVRDLRAAYPGNPEAMVDFVSDANRFAVDGRTTAQTVKGVMILAQLHRGFGPWIAFKIADMVDRCLGLPVNFDEGALLMFKDPMIAVDMLWQLRWPEEQGTTKEERVRRVVLHLSNALSELKAPPTFDRQVNVQECETVLCKWKSHMKGFYPLGNDINDIRGGMFTWARISPTAKLFEQALPQWT